MPRYVDGFVIPIPKNKAAQYRSIAKKACKIWMEHGALEYIETLGDDLKIKGMGSFLKMAGAKPTETIVFAWIVYKSRAHRDSVNKKIMADPRMKKMMETTDMPFDCKRMAYGGFKVIVSS